MNHGELNAREIPSAYISDTSVVNFLISSHVLLRTSAEVVGFLVVVFVGDIVLICLLHEKMLNACPMKNLCHSDNTNTKNVLQSSAITFAKA